MEFSSGIRLVGWFFGLTPRSIIFRSCSAVAPFQLAWDFGQLSFPSHLGKYFIKIGKISAKKHEIGKIKAIFGLGMTPI